VLLECPTDDELSAFVAGDRPPGVDLFRNHLDSCSNCRRAVSAVAATRARAAVSAGTRLGRFTMQRLLGEGAMGEVWAAHDPELDREVAIKLLRVTSARWRREAQAMARVRHPNVVAIYDLGWTDDHAFCAMELVDGETLRAYLATPRPWQAVLRVALAVGRGVSAAHGTGVIHRDIKPENILIARDGRTLVSDFGLAKLAGPDDPAAEESRPAVPIDPGATHLTTQGMLIGTPAYMAPEQLAGDPASLLSDQFSFCVVVYEALFGTRPFRAASVGALRESIGKGLARRPELRGVPKRVLDVLERGLAADPARRWPSMNALVDALERTMQRRRWYRVAVVPVLAAALAVTVYLATRSDGPSEADATDSAERTIAAAWNPSIAQRLAAAFARVDPADGPARAAVLTATLDKYRDDWLAHRRDAWRATHVSGEQTIELLERRLACFDRLADAITHTVTLLVEPAADEVQRAPELAARLEPIASCDNAQRVAAESIAPSSPLGSVVAEELNRIKALLLVGRSDEALRRASAALADPSTVADPILHARARYNLGVALRYAGRWGEAESVLRLAVQEAAEAHDHYLVASVWTRLVEVVSFQRPKDAIALEPVAQAAVAQAGNDPQQLAELAFNLGVAEVDLKAARDHFLEARDRWISIDGADHPLVAMAESGLGAVLLEAGELDEASTYLDHARQIVLTRQGEKDPVLASIDINRGEVAARRGDLRGAEAALRSALAVGLAVSGPAYRTVRVIRMKLSRVLLAQHRDSEAAQALALARENMTADDAVAPFAIDIDEVDAEVALDEHQWTRAEALAKRAMAAYERLGDEELHSVAMDDLAKAVVHRSPRDALALEERSLAELLKAPPPVGEMVEALSSMASVAIAAHRPEVALAWFDKYPDAAAKLTDDRAALERLRHK
jgi:tetratricopeptide (TPR) repeat protein